MYKVTHIVYSALDPSDRKPIVADETGAVYDGPIETVGFLWKIGEQYFNREGFEVVIPDFIKSIDQFIRHDEYSDTRDLFFATRADGKKTIVITQFYDDEGRTMAAFDIEECNLRNYPDTRFDYLEKDLEIVPMDLKGTLFEEWITKYDPGLSRSRLEDWLLLKEEFGYYFMYLPDGRTLSITTAPGRREKALMKMPEPNEYGDTPGYRALDPTKNCPEFFNDPVLGKCMRIGEYQADEGTISAECNIHRSLILMYII